MYNLNIYDQGEIISSQRYFPLFLHKQASKTWRSPLHAVFHGNDKGKILKGERTPPVLWSPWALAYSRDRPYNLACLSAMSIVSSNCAKIGNFPSYPILRSILEKKQRTITWFAKQKTFPATLYEKKTQLSNFEIFLLTNFPKEFCCTVLTSRSIRNWTAWRDQRPFPSAMRFLPYIHAWSSEVGWRSFKVKWQLISHQSAQLAELVFVTNTQGNSEFPWLKLSRQSTDGYMKVSFMHLFYGHFSMVRILNSTWFSIVSTKTPVQIESLFKSSLSVSQ